MVLAMWEPLVGSFGMSEVQRLSYHGFKVRDRDLPSYCRQNTANRGAIVTNRLLFLTIICPNWNVITLYGTLCLV